MAKKVLITGTSGGFGELIANTLIDKGHTVVASMRGLDGRNKEAAKSLDSKGAHVVEIDVTDEESVDSGVAKAAEAAGGLDVVVNNAGVGVLGLQETFTAKDWSRLFDINVFGVQRVNRAALPHLRKQRAGLLIHVSSLLGRFVLPFMGPYNASKYALEALAENYRVELSAFGVDSVIVEPGAYGTGFQRNLVLPSDTERAGGYGDFAHAPMGMMESFEQNLHGENAPDPQWVADAVVTLVEKPAGQRPFRTVVDGLGMGEHIERYNESGEKVTAGIYDAFGMGDMLKLKV